MERREPSIFISHSSRDIQVARAARNLLEDRQHHVLLLGLLQNMSDKQILNLLEAEIVAREWLVLIDTPNARQSKWVRFELERARHHKRTVYSISGERFMEGHDRYAIEQGIKPCIDSFSRGLRTFLSYSRRDSANLARYIHNFLTEHGFESWIDMELRPGMDWQQQIQNTIDDTLERGVFIPLVSPGTMEREFVRAELEYALSRDGMVLPVLAAPVDFRTLPPALQRIQFLDMTRQDNIDQQLHQMLDILTNMRHQQFSRHCGQIVQ